MHWAKQMFKADSLSWILECVLQTLLWSPSAPRATSHIAPSPWVCREVGLAVGTISSPKGSSPRKPLLSLISAALPALAWHGGCCTTERALITSVLVERGDKEGNNHPMASDSISYSVGRPYLLTALGELCDFPEEGRESFPPTPMPSSFLRTK